MQNAARQGPSLLMSLLFAAPVVLLTVISVASLLYIGLLINSQQKLNFICNQAVIFACNSGLNRPGNAPGFALSLGRKLNLPINPSDVKLKHEQIEVSPGVTAPGYTVYIKAWLPLPFKVGTMGTISGSSTAAIALSQFNDYNAVLTFETPRNSQKALLIPAFYVPAPNGSNPYRYLPYTTCNFKLLQAGLPEKSDSPVAITGIHKGEIEPDTINGFH